MVPNWIRSYSSSIPSVHIPTVLYSGVGIAEDYTWREEAFEIEITVKVPPETKAKDIRFRAKTKSIELTLLRKTESGEEVEVTLLDSARPLRGRVVVDGSYWVVSDAIEDEARNSRAESAATDSTPDGDEDEPNGRQVTVTIEKQIKTPKDDFEVIDYDWNGVYLEEEEGEVSYRKYDKPEELDVREYASSLGVDIDNINMSMVDKSMFASGLNLTKSGMDSMVDAGLMQEVTKQEDGSEWTADKDGFRVPYNSMLNEKKEEGADDVTAGTNDDGHLQKLHNENGKAEEGKKDKGIPFLDTDSPWHKAPDPSAGTIEETSAGENPKENKVWEKKKKQLQAKREKEAMDPIATLKVARLREILRSRGLKVSGNKKELQDRLRAEVQLLVEDTE